MADISPNTRGAQWPTANICLQQIRIYGFHGNSPEEQQVGSWFETDLSIQTRVSPAALEDDDLSGTIDYSAALAIVQAEFAKPARLLEHLAHRTAHAVLRTFPSALSVSITVRKMTPPMRGNVRAAAVSLTVGR